MYGRWLGVTGYGKCERYRARESGVSYEDEGDVEGKGGLGWSVYNSTLVVSEDQGSSISERKMMDIGGGRFELGDASETLKGKFGKGS